MAKATTIISSRNRSVWPDFKPIGSEKVSELPIIEKMIMTVHGNDNKGYSNGK